MSDEEYADVPISAERLVAAFLKTFGKIQISVETLLADYSNFQVAVEQDGQGHVTFQLVGEDDES